MKILYRGLLAAACATAVAAAPASAATGATVRVEGFDATVVPATKVALEPGTFRKFDGGPTCSRTSAGGALEAATGGDWTGPERGGGQVVERIRTVTLPWDDQQRYWAFWVNQRFASQGLCEQELSEGDEVVLYTGCYLATTACFNGTPLDLRAPATVKPGQPFAVTVQQVDFDGNWNPVDAPSQGATVSGGGASATTGADGRATLTLTTRGATTLTATKPDHPREAVPVCVTDGADGFCGTTTPAGETFEPAPQGTAPAGAPPAAPGDPAIPGAPASGPVEPKALVTGLREQQRFARGQGPRVLRGRAQTAGAAVRMVKLRLTRTDRGRCTAFSGRRERLIRRPRCGASTGWWFTVAERADWEYQLPGRLPRGRYVLDVNVVDREFRRDDARRRGENRVVFHVG
jgi:hypothetical protein